MAENTTTGAPLSGSDSENFMRLMSRALDRIEKVDKATTKANDSLKEYAKTFDELNDKLGEYVKLSGGVKATKFKGSVSGGRTSGGSRSSGKDDSDKLEDTIQKLNNKTKKAVSESGDLLFNAINSLGGKYSKVLTKSIQPALKVMSKSKAVASTAKEVSKYSAEAAAAGKATSGLTKIVAGLGTKAAVAGGVVAGLVLVIGLMEEAGRYAYERNMQLNRSLMQMGVASDELTSTTATSANKMISIKNTWTRIGDDLAGAFEPFFNVCVDFVDWLSTAIEGITKPLDKDNDKQYDYAHTRVRGYSKNLENISGEPENKSLPVLADIASSSKQSGFSNDSAANLAIGTYDTAIKLARKYGLEASEVAKQLSDAWLNGSDAAKEYGVVVDDQVLAGFMASKGVDIVNTQITDAMKQYYRYQLLQEQTSADNSDYMQDNIKKWKQLGIQIEATKGKLFSFDEVIQLNAMDTTIPDVGKQEVSYPGKDGNENIGGIPPIIPPSGGGGGLPGTPTVPEISPVYVPVYYYEPEPYAPPVPAPVTVPVFVPGLELIPELVTGLAYVYGLLPMPIPLPVTVPGFEWIPQLQEALERIPGTVPVNVPVTVPGFELAPNLLTYCLQLAAQPFMSTVMFTIPALALAPTLLGYLGEIAQTWASKVDISVVGQAVLERALSLLQQVRSLLSSLGQPVVGGIQRAGQTIKTGVSTAYANMKSTASSFGAGFSGQGNQAGLLGKWAPTSAEAYGGGFLGALQADLDLNLTRMGFNSATKEGYTTQQLKEATAQYTGYQLNPFNKNSGTQLAAKGVAASALIASGYGALTSGAATVGTALSTAGTNFLNSLGSLAPGLAFGFANGGIGTKEVNNATLFEGDKKEAVIPLETTEGIRYLSDALQQAGYGGGTGGDSYTINLTLSGINIADNEAQWEKVGKKLAEVIDVQRQRRGELNYGSNF